MRKKAIQNISLNNYSIAGLESQLSQLKVQQKNYRNLNKKLRDLQRKQQQLHQEELTIQQQQQKYKLQLQTLKSQLTEYIEKCKTLEDDYKKIKKNIIESNQQLKKLQKNYEQIRITNFKATEKLKSKVQYSHELELQLENLMKNKEKTEVRIDQLKDQVYDIAQQEYKLKKQVQKQRVHQMQQEYSRQNAIKYSQKLIQQNKLLQQEIAIKERILASQTQKYYNLEEQLRVFEQEQSHLMNEYHKKAQQSQSITKNAIDLESKIVEIKKQIQISKKDMQLLTDEYMKECQLLREKQDCNTDLNLKMDLLIKDVTHIWDGIRDSMDLCSQKQRMMSKMERKLSIDERKWLDQYGTIEKDGWKTWMQIQQIINS